MKRNSSALSDVNKSRYGRVSLKKKYDEEFQTALKKSYDDIDESLSTKTNRTSSASNQTHVLNNGFVIGDIVWAKTGKYPVWPGIVISDPISNTIFKKVNNCAMLHIYYFNDDYRRNWITTNQIFKFSSKKKVLSELPKTYTHISRNIVKTKWNRAVDEAECLAAMTRDSRIAAFFANNFLPNVSVSLMDTSEICNPKRRKTRDNTSANDKTTIVPTNSLKVRNSKSSKSKDKISPITKNTTAPSNSLQGDISSKTRTEPEPILKGNSSEKNKQTIEKSSDSKTEPDAVVEVCNSKNKMSPNVMNTVAPINSLQGDGSEKKKQKVGISSNAKTKLDAKPQVCNSKSSSSKDKKSPNAKNTAASTNSIRVCNSKSSNSKDKISPISMDTSASTNSFQSNSSRKNKQTIENSSDSETEPDAIVEVCNSKSSNSKGKTSRNGPIAKIIAAAASTNSLQSTSSRKNKQTIEDSSDNEIEPDAIVEVCNSKSSNSKDKISPNGMDTSASTNSFQSNSSRKNKQTIENSSDSETEPDAIVEVCNSKSSNSKGKTSRNVPIAKITVASTNFLQGNSSEKIKQTIEKSSDSKTEPDAVVEVCNSKNSISKDKTFSNGPNSKNTAASTKSLRGNSAEINKQTIENSSDSETEHDAIMQGDSSEENKQVIEISSNAKTKPDTIPQKRKLSPTDNYCYGRCRQIQKLNESYISRNFHKLVSQNSCVMIPINDLSDHPRVLIPELCKQFYLNRWVTGTGGGISIKYNDEIYIAPSGVQKERIQPEDLFVQDMDGEDISSPLDNTLSKSQCTPIFMCSYKERNAGAVIHIHSEEVVKLCLLNPENELRIKDLEIIKGIFNEEEKKFYDNDEEVIVPIIDNTKYERDLVDNFRMALTNYPKTSAVLVRNHGMYVWGKDWKSAKTQCECYDYAFKIMVFKKIHKL